MKKILLLTTFFAICCAFGTDIAELRKNLADQISGSVRWEESIRSMVETIKADTVIEFGPGAVLTGLVKRTLPEMKLFNINSADSLNNIAF